MPEKFLMPENASSCYDTSGHPYPKIIMEYKNLQQLEKALN